VHQNITQSTSTHPTVPIFNVIIATKALCVSVPLWPIRSFFSLRLCVFATLR
jgi:hypothetical protein